MIKKHDEMCKEPLMCMGDDKKLQKKYETEYDSFIYKLKPDILWIA
tara:strand:+ start:2203 stop:2340 length:138 start_codon:yes stop_codon:yes gene_type:complete